MKVKLSNTELRARLLDNWKKKFKYSFLHAFYCGNKCDTCSDGCTCSRYRKMNWIEWNIKNLRF